VSENLILKNARVIDRDGEVRVDIAISDGRFAEIAADIAGNAETFDCEDCLVVPGFVESHIHLDKSCLLERCTSQEGTLQEAIREVAAAKRDFTVADVYARGQRTLERAIVNGTTHMRTHVEVDPVVGLTSFEAIKALKRDYAWAVDLEICVFPQDGMLNNPGTEELMIAALRDGADLVGGCPYTDSDPAGQISRVFEIAREFDVDIDFHLDFDIKPEGLTLFNVCEVTERFGWGGRVTIGHVSKLSALPPEDLAKASKRLASAGVSLTVLPATDLFLMGSDHDHNVPRGVVPVARVAAQGVTSALSTNNVLNPFTPFGDCSLLRMANLYANIGQIGTRQGHRDCLAYVTDAPARLMRLEDYGIAVGNPADLVLLDCASSEAAVREIADPLAGFKAGRRTFTRSRPSVHSPDVDLD
jgi:cytosine deaminase